MMSLTRQNMEMRGTNTDNETRTLQSCGWEKVITYESTKKEQSVERKANSKLVQQLHIRQVGRQSGDRESQGM